MVEVGAEGRGAPARTIQRRRQKREAAHPALSPLPSPWDSTGCEVPRHRSLGASGMDSHGRRNKAAQPIERVGLHLLLLPFSPNLEEMERFAEEVSSVVGQ